MSNCELCGEPMPEGEEMFKYHGYSGPCPKQAQGDSEEAAFRKAMSRPAEVWYPCGCKASAGAPKYCPVHQMDANAEQVQHLASLIETYADLWDEGMVEHVGIAMPKKQKDAFKAFLLCFGKDLFKLPIKQAD